MIEKLTELEAINQMLAYAGEQPVNSLTNDGTNDVTVALQTLRNHIRKILAGTHHFNTIVRTCVPDSLGIISLPNNTLSADTVDNATEACARGKPPKLFNKATDSFVWTEAVDVEIVQGLEFEQMSAPAQNFVTAKASRDYQMIATGSRSMDNLLAERENEARIAFNTNDIVDSDVNLLTSTNSPFCYIIAEKRGS